MEIKDDLSGFRGWLLLYLIITMLGGGLFLIGTFLSAAYGGPNFLILTLGYGVIFATTLFFTFKRSRKSKIWNIILLWSNPLLILIGATSFFAGTPNYQIILNIPINGRWIQQIWFIFGTIIWAIIWTLYIKKSARVQNTLTR